MHVLGRRWVADCAVAAPTADPSVVEDVGRDLIGRWQEPHRRYHDATHLGEVLAAVDALCAAERVPADGRVVATLAAWFHDAVYAVGPVAADSGAGASAGLSGPSAGASAEASAGASNEAASASLAARQLRRLGVGATATTRVVTVVLDTLAHELSDDAAQDPARVVVHDADLWVLAAPLARFDEYCAQVRQEYAHVPVADYARARSGVLRPFLVREHVYRTAFARAAWEPVARENLARELTRLAG